MWLWVGFSTESLGVHFILPLISRYFTSLTGGWWKKIFALILMLVGNSLEIGCKMKVGFLVRRIREFRKKNYRLFKGKSGFPVHIWALFGSYREKIESICHLFPFRPYFRVISGVFTGNMQAICGLFTFHRYFTGSLRTALFKEYQNFFTSLSGKGRSPKSLI